MRVLIVLLASMIASGCSTWRHVDEGGSKDVSSMYFAHAIPPGWTYRVLGRHEVIASRDGPALQEVTSNFLRWDASIAGDPERQHLLQSSLPTDAAEQVLAARRRELDVEVIELEKIAPATLANLVGFRTEYRYRTSTGIDYRGVSYGGLHREGLYLLRFEAPAVIYYERGLAPFELVAASVRPTTAAERKRFKERGVQ